MTGGGTGIGLGIARRLAAAGAHVTIAGRRGDVLEAAATRLGGETGATVATVVCDVVDAADGTARMPLTELGRIAHYQPTQLPNDINPELQITRHFRFNDVPYIFTNGIHGALVEVDVDTGFFRLLKHWVIEDCGRMINPLLADEQVRGGAVQGPGQPAERDHAGGDGGAGEGDQPVDAERAVGTQECLRTDQGRRGGPGRRRGFGTGLARGSGRGQESERGLLDPADSESGDLRRQRRDGQ